MKYFPLVWAGLWRKRTRTILTMLSVVVAFLLFGVLQGINQGFQLALRNLDIDRLFVSARFSMSDGLPIAYLNRIKGAAGVRAVSFWTYFGGYFQNARQPISAFATDAEALFKIYKGVAIKPEYLEAMRTTRTGALVSEQLALKYGWKVGDRVPIGTSIWTKKDGGRTWEFDIVGTYDASGHTAGFPSFYLNYSYFAENSAFGKGIVHYYLVAVQDPTLAPQTAKTIDAMFANSTNETRTQTESALAQTNLKQLGDINFIANAIVGAVVFALLFLTANTMMQSVHERTSELAVLKTLGFSGRKVLGLVLTEALILCSFAGAVGLALAGVVFRAPMLQAVFGNFSMPMIVIAMGAGLMLSLAGISGFLPAWRAKQLNIVDALAGR